MTHVRVAVFVLAVLPSLSAAESRRSLGCTAIALDAAASEDASAYAGMNADCSSCDFRIAYIPARDPPEGAKRPLHIIKGTAPRFVGYGRGSFYEPKPGETLSPKLGEIPEARHTFAYWEAVLPLMNEKGLTLGESSCAARLLNYPRGQAPVSGDPRTGRNATEGMLDLTNMMEIALERCETARCAVKLMGFLAEEYGFFPMVGEWSLGAEADGKVAFADGGEAVTVADRTGEAWIFHVVGGVPGVARSVWAAMRLPKGHAAFVANNFILRAVPEEQSDDWLFSPRIREAARAAGFWDGTGPLDWTRTFAPDTVTFQSPAGEAPIPLYGSLRNWRLFGLVAPSAYEKAKLPVDPLDLPVSIPVERKMGHRDVFALLSDIYEGTEFDLTQGVLAGPFGNPFRLEGGYATRNLGQIPRGISIARTSYSTIGQSRPRAEPVLWFAPDTPATSVYVPFFPSAGGRHAAAYSHGLLAKFSRDSAYWAFDLASNWASLVNWRNASGQFLRPLRAQLHDEIAAEMVEAERRATMEGVQALAAWQERTQQRVVDRWWQLVDDLIVAYNDGNFNDAKTNRMGLSIGYPDWWARQIGFDQDVHPIFVKRDREADARYAREPQKAPPTFQASRSPLPSTYNFRMAMWLYANVPDVMAASPPSGVLPSPALLQCIATVGCLLVGFSVGRSYERKDRRVRGDAYLSMP